MSFMDELKNLKIPDIPSKDFKLHDDYEWIKQNCHKWLTEISFPNKLFNENHCDWICYVYSNAISKERLLLICKLGILLTFIDDKSEDFASNNNYDGLVNYFNGLKDAVINFTAINENSSYEAKLFREIFAEMMPELSDKQSNLVINSICDVFKLSIHIQCNYRRLNKYVGLETYMSYRRIDLCTHLLVLFGEYSLGIDFNDDIRCNKDFKELKGLCMDRLIIFADILSFKVELIRGEIMNYVIVYLNEQQCSLQEAVNNAFRDLIEIDNKYLDCIKRCLNLNEPSIAEFINSCLGLSHGFVKWHYETNRYLIGKNELNDSKLLEIENNIKHKQIATHKDIPLSEVIGEQNAKLYQL